MNRRLSRKVLLVTPYFAPQSHAAMFRVHKLAKYLPRYGWKPYVVTTGTNYLYQEDRGLLDDLPAEVEVYRARYLEPTARGIRMALGGKDRRYVAANKEEDADDRRAKRPSASNRLYKAILGRWIQVPDALWTWGRPAIRLASTLAREQSIPIVYTTFLPYTSCRIGSELTKDRLRWVADFRDPGTYEARFRSPYPTVASVQRSLERLALKKADAVTVLSSAYPSIFEHVHKDIGTRPMHFIPTGADDDLVDRVERAETGFPYLIFAGEYLSEYGNEFFDLFRRAITADVMKGTKLQLLIVGNRAVNQPLVQPLVDRFGLVGRVELIDHMPQGNLYRYIRGAEAAVLVLPGTEMWWNNFAKMVDYIALGVPVLAMVPDPSESRKELESAGTGVFLDGSLNEASERLVAFVSGGKRPRVDPAVQRQYLATAQVKSFVEVFEELLESQASPA